MRVKRGHLLALDAHYLNPREGETATAVNVRVAGVSFDHIDDSEPAREQVLEIAGAARYQPGAFYLREMPGLLALIETFDEPPRLIFVDGYVWLDRERDRGADEDAAFDHVSSCLMAPGLSPTSPRPGMGARLWQALGCHIPVIGVAKSRFRGAPATIVYRRGSRRALYITSAGIPAGEAAWALLPCTVTAASPP